MVLAAEQIQFSGLGEIGLSREQRQAGETLVMVPSHAGGGDCQQRAAETVAGGMDLDMATNSLDRLDRGYDAFDGSRRAMSRSVRADCQKSRTRALRRPASGSSNFHGRSRI